MSAIKSLYDAHPKAEDMKITNLILRYIDATEFDFRTRNIFEFLEKLKLKISLPDNLFKDRGIENRPNGLTWQCSFKCEKPRGLINLRFATAQKSNENVLVWETTVESAENELPEMPKEFESWIEAAHEITDDWFFKMIEGELERRFSGE
jgi:uncharacterized protein (TIGR04255 family)